MSLIRFSKNRWHIQTFRKHLPKCINRTFSFIVTNFFLWIQICWERYLSMHIRLKLSIIRILYFWTRSLNLFLYCLWFIGEKGHILSTISFINISQLSVHSAHTFHSNLSTHLDYYKWLTHLSPTEWDGKIEFCYFVGFSQNIFNLEACVGLVLYQFISSLIIDIT